MKNLMFIFMLLFAFLCTNYAMAESVPVSVVEQPAVQTAPVVPQMAPVKSVDEIKLTVKDEAFVPPEWLQDALLNAKNIPVVGPFLVTAMKWLGVLVSVITALFAFLWALLRAGQVVLSAAKMAELAEKLALLENSKLMYYLKAFSMFNAQKKDKPV